MESLVIAYVGVPVIERPVLRRPTGGAWEADPGSAGPLSGRLVIICSDGSPTAPSVRANAYRHAGSRMIGR
jgi:hypothetical protein